MEITIFTENTFLAENPYAIPPTRGCEVIPLDQVEPLKAERLWLFLPGSAMGRAAH